MTNVNELTAIIEDLFPLAPLGLVDHARLMAKAKSMYEELHPETRAGAAQGAGAKRLHGHLAAQSAPCFRNYVVAQAKGRRGWKDTAVKEAIRRGEKIAAEVLDVLEESEFETVGRMNELAKLNTVEEQLVQIAAWKLPPKPVVPTGEVAQFGRVRLECADSRGTMGRMLMTGTTFDLILVDPPYGVRREARDLGIMEGDEEEGSLWSVALMAKLLSEGGYLALWTAQSSFARWAQAISDAGLTIVMVRRWHKPNVPDYVAPEYLIVAGHAPRPDLGALSCETLPRDHYLREVHQSPKPVELMESVIDALLPHGGTIADFFAGTCPVGVAALRKGYSYTGFEMNPKVFAAAVQELQDTDKLGEVALRAA